MNDSTTRVTTTLMVHANGPVHASIARLDERTDPYAVIKIGTEAPVELTLFPDAAALDSLIAEATRVRDIIAEHARRAVKYVTRLGDDSDVPARGLVIGFDPEDDEYVFVRWEGEGPGADALAREAFDELSPAR